jgi:hypothetical protein
MADCASENFMQYLPNGGGGEQGLEFLSGARFKDEEDDDADGFYHADGPDLVSIPVSEKMGPCMRRFTYAEEIGMGRQGLKPKAGAVTAIPTILLTGNLNSNQVLLRFSCQVCLMHLNM